MAGYSGTPLWEKLGYKTGMSAYVDGESKDYRSLLALPADVVVTWLSRAKSKMEFVHLFATSASTLKRKLESYRTRIVPGGVIWVSWPKKSSGVKSDVTEDAIRDAADCESVCLPLVLATATADLSLVRPCLFSERSKRGKLKTRRNQDEQT